MSKFKLNPLSIALLGAIATPTFAETTTENQNHQLSTIVVSAAGFEQDIKNAPASISVVTKEDIERKNATSIADLLVDIPGVDVRNGVGKTTGLNISMRGMGADDTLILIDGRRQTTSTDVTPNGFAETSTSFMPPVSAIERIEVIRGPMSTLYGSDAMGGVINIITKKVSDEWNGNITVSGNVMESGAEADSWKTSFLLNGPLINNKLGLQLRGSYFDRSSSERVVEGSTSRDPRPNTAENFDFGGKLTFKADEKNALWIDAFHSSQSYDNKDSRLGDLDWVKEPNKAAGYKDELKFNRSQFAIGHDGDYNFGVWKSYISLSETETKGRTIPTEAFLAAQQINNPLIGTDRVLKNEDLIANTHLISRLDNHKITTGAEYKKLIIKDNLTAHDPKGSEKFDKDSWSIYAEDEWTLLENLMFTYGTRYEKHSGFGGKFSPRAYLVWNTNDILTIKGGVSTGYKAPSAKDLFDGLINLRSQGRAHVFGNPDLKPETSTNYELGFNLQPTDKLNLSATGFYNQIKDVITSESITNNCTASRGCSRSINADKAKVYGAEVTLQYSIIPEWDIKAAYTYTKSKITDSNNPETVGSYYNNNPRNAFNLTSTWHINPAIDVWLQHEYKSSRVRYKEVPNSTELEELAIYNASGNEYSGYNLFNLGASYTVTDRLRLNMAVNNLLDKDFTENQTIPYGSGDETQSYKYLSGNEGTYIAGRNYWLSISYDF
ncbi:MULTISPECIES: TonB-dependent receptor domain-containing protein [Acinetobacter]|uniref:TonB-dependent receptor domain-containing protein n=1 Tax=Acinetobacter TaxID=469 RepID=UPI002799C7B2|nr:MULTISPECIES: TonB-dependent receptor [Acinetobacter]MDY6483574.1 TonB-dependent receptor [Acinetobacter faecalis]MDY6529610.1 TonB-dependent receptor [Acinetobacter faecalis]MDY6536787.1 TonB-dependent receptor [Acinetobacter faecalis]WFP97179.1 TonB-dependent receptor [Acinetobacter sp. ANC 7201]